MTIDLLLTLALFLPLVIASTGLAILLIMLVWNVINDDI